MLTDELRNAARLMGEALHASQTVQTYLRAHAAFEADPEAVELEKSLLTMYMDLVHRQQSGEILQRSEIDAFNDLKNRVRRHPLIFERDAALKMLKRYFVAVAEEINFPLGLEFPALVKTAYD